MRKKVALHSLPWILYTLRGPREMSDSQHRRFRTGTEYERWWKDETENLPLPESWAAAGRHEPVEDDEAALQTRCSR
jgi:hypothetical protein